MALKPLKNQFLDTTILLSNHPFDFEQVLKDNADQLGYLSFQPQKYFTAHLINLSRLVMPIPSDELIQQSLNHGVRVLPPSIVLSIQPICYTHPRSIHFQYTVKKCPYYDYFNRQVGTYNDFWLSLRNWDASSSRIFTSHLPEKYLCSLCLKRYHPYSQEQLSLF